MPTAQTTPDTYAIIQLLGKQHQVMVGDQLTVDRLPNLTDEVMKITDVLLIKKGEVVTIGAPTIKGATVSLKVLAHEAGDKLRVATYKAKSRYRKTKGYRHSHTVLEVTAIA